jgi:hypothetical protein
MSRKPFRVAGHGRSDWGRKLERCQRPLLPTSHGNNFRGKQPKGTPTVAPPSIINRIGGRTERHGGPYG